MKIIDLLDDKSIRLNAEVHSKKEVLDTLVDLMDASGKLNDIETYRKGVYAREEEGSTGIGEGIAIPHCKSAAVNQAGLAAMVAPKGVEFDSLDGEPANLFFLIAAPDTADNVHLDVLSHLSVLLMDPDFTGKLREAETVEEFKKVIEMAENEPEEEKEQTEVDANVPYVLAVTGCPTGIAHTYMAAEALERKAEELGYQIKVETRGSSGAKNVLTAEEIAKADGIIVAADTKVPMERFDGKPVIITKVADGINKPEELIRKIVDKQAPVYKSEEAQETVSENTEKKGIGHAVYQHLMSGVSHMLPFVIGGGIMIALAFLLDQIMGVPKDQLPHLGSYNELPALFKSIGDIAFSFMLPILAGYIAYSIAEKPGLIAGFAAGAIAKAGLAYGNIVVYAKVAGLDENAAKEAVDKISSHQVSSGFLGALVGGFLAGGIVLLLRKYIKVPRALEGAKSILLMPLLGVALTGFVMLAVNIPMAAINTGLNNFLSSLSGSSAVLLGLLVGGMMAVDMGGPVNKAAYVFATGTLAETVTSGGSVVMAAVMAAGMVPPLAVFVATVLFKDKFSQEERDSGLTNIVMGLSFITEGAIPFGAADPARAIPSFIVGSALTGALVGMAGIKLMAPHGGIFVIALTSNALLYLLFILIGAVVSGILFGFLRKPLDK